MRLDVLCRGWAVLTREPMFLDLYQGQPLVMHREPHNRYDANAIIMCDLFGQPLSYMHRAKAAILAPRIDAGELWLARVKFVIGLHMRDFMAVAWHHNADGIEDPGELPLSLRRFLEPTELAEAHDDPPGDDT